MYQDLLAVHVMPYYVETSYTCSLTTGYASPEHSITNSTDITCIHHRSVVSIPSYSKRLVYHHSQQIPISLHLHPKRSWQAWCWRGANYNLSQVIYGASVSQLELRSPVVNYQNYHQKRTSLNFLSVLFLCKISKQQFNLI